NAERADFLFGLDKGAARIVAADDAEFVRNAAFLREAKRGGNTGVRDGHDDVGLHARLLRQTHAHALADFVDGAPVGDRVRTREIDELEDARPRLALAERE